jgi:ATP phosphoribosyltransferase
MSDKAYILAVPKGRILKELLPLLEKANIRPEDKFFDPKDRSLRFTTNHAALDIIRVRSFDVATFVAYGAAHFGVAGSDVLEEYDYDGLYAPLDLNIGHCRLSLAQPAELQEADNPIHSGHLRVATKYPLFTQRFFSQRGMRAQCIKLNGAMELAPSLGLCQHIVDLVSTGTTLRANGLKEVEVLSEVSSRLIVSRAALKTDRGPLESFLTALEDAVMDHNSTA